MQLSDLRRVNRRAIHLAGPRYMPGQDPAAPNLEIASLSDVLDAIGLTGEFRAKVDRLRAEVHDEWSGAPESFRAALTAAANNPRKLFDQLEDLRNSAPASAGVLVHHIRQSALVIYRMSQRRLAALRQRLEGVPEGTDARRDLEHQVHRVQLFARRLSSIREFGESASAMTLGTNRLLVLGRWGTGKTHSLCDVAQRRMSRGLATLLVLGQQLPDGMDPLEGVCDATDLAKTPKALLRSLQRLGHRTNGRALLIIDAINEGDRRAWKRSLLGISRQLERHPNVALILSCRQPFDEQIVSRRLARRFVAVRHEGFAEQEFDAQLSFFEYYQIPAPHFPLITAEFSRPLFLRLLCESLEHLSRRHQHRQLRQFASGQRGMTFLLERFVDHVGAAIEDEFGFARGTCWRILKGAPAVRGGPVVGVAPSMAAQPTETLTVPECLRAIELFLTGAHRRGKARQLLRRMTADGLLAEDARWTAGGYVPVIRFPYQRFGDHIIARHLITQHLKVDSEVAIRRSLYANRPLGKIFELKPSDTSYRMPGLASALMVEFPERVRRRLPDDRRELVFYLPRSRQYIAPLAEAFLESLPWRSNESFCDQTHSVVNILLGGTDRETRNEVIEVLLGLATREGHVYSASRFQAWLQRMQMPDRDLVWSEYVRLASRTSTPYRLVEWVDRHAPDSISEQAAETSSRLLSMLLTATVRPLRDRATRALFLIGLKHPAVLFSATLDLLGFNDPYVPERLLAACYGAAMSCWAAPPYEALRAALPAFARRLAQAMFVPPCEHGTRHSLARGYALGTIAVARMLDRNAISPGHVRFLKAPFNQLPAPFDPTGALTDEEREETSPAIQMDFGNYTLGTLVPGRNNYDNNHPDYRVVRDQVLGRMHQLGYRHSLFGTIDRSIMDRGGYERTQDGNRTDRYGKKYSWIAYFELTGLRIDRGLLASDWRDPERSDADVDPSFPRPAPRWSVGLADLFRDAPTAPIPWLRSGPTPQYNRLLARTSVDGIRGPWILLNGFLEQDQDVRHVFTFLRGMLVRPADLHRLERAFLARDYPGNDAIPRTYEDHYTYAGEIPWSPRFANSLRYRDGRARRHVQRALSARSGGRRRAGVMLEVPAHDYSWGPTYSVLNENTGADVPTPSICEYLGLVNYPQQLDLYDASGRPASLFRGVSQAGTTHGRGTLLYIRRGLLRRYLRQTGQQFVWMVWGERNFTTGSGMHERDDIRDAWRDYRHIHRRFVVL